jgi:hypothetical protein
MIIIEGAKGFTSRNSPASEEKVANKQENILPKEKETHHKTVQNTYCGSDVTTPCSLVDCYQRSRGIYYLHLQGKDHKMHLRINLIKNNRTNTCMFNIN